jgi:hypothetical protein
MITVTLTTFNGNTKKYNVPNPTFFISQLEKALPKTVTVHVSCDALGISGHVTGTV